VLAEGSITIDKEVLTLGLLLSDISIDLSEEDILVTIDEATGGILRFLELTKTESVDAKEVSGHFRRKLANRRS